MDRRTPVEPGSKAATRELSRWTHATMDACASTSPSAGLRIAALVHLTIWEAVCGAVPEARVIALAAASHEALTLLAPASEAMLGEAWTQSAALVCRGDLAAATIAQARKGAAARIAAHVSQGDVPAADAIWHSLRPLRLKESETWFRSERLESGTRIEVDEVHEVLNAGGRDAAGRNADQTAAAIFWCASPTIIRRAAMAAALSACAGELAARTRTLACVAIAVSDAQLLAARIKARTAASRPSALIRGDAPSRLWVRSHRPDWSPLVDCPADTELPSEWGVALGAGIGALRAMGGSEEIEVDVGCPAVGLMRRFGSLSGMLQESEDARVWAGWHFRSTAVESTEIGLQLGEHVAGAAEFRGGECMREAAEG
jgi:hypothetical protein